MNAQSRLLGAKYWYVYQMHLYVALSQSFQLYHITYVEQGWATPVMKGHCPTEFSSNFEKYHPSVTFYYS